MKPFINCIFLFCLINFTFAQTIEDKIDFTYDNFNQGNYANSSKYLKEIKDYFINQGFEFVDVINFFDLAIASYYAEQDYRNAIEFAENKILFVSSNPQSQFKDSIIAASKISLFFINQENRNIMKALEVLDEIIKLCKGKGGFFLYTYIYFSFFKKDFYLRESTNYKAAINTLEELKINNLLFYNDHSIEMVEIYVELGINYMEISNFELSENYLQKSLNNLKKHENEFSVLGIQTIINLGSLYRRIGNNELALEYYEKAEINGDSVFGMAPLLLSNLLQNKANLLNKFNDFEKFNEIVSLYLKTIEIRKNELGVSHSEYAKALINFGMYYSHIGHYEKAENLINLGEEIFKNNYGLNYIGIATAKAGLSGISLDLDNFQLAYKLLNDELSIYISNQSENTLEYASTKSRLARFYWSIRNYKNAILEFENSIELYLKLFSENDNYVINEKLALARLYNEIGNFTKAKEILRPIAGVNVNSEHYNFENYFDGNYWFNHFDYTQGSQQSSNLNDLSLLKKIEKSELKNSRSHVLLLERIALFELNQGDFESALKRCWLINSVNVDNYGISHSKVAESFQVLSRIYITIGDLDSASYYLNEASKIKTDVFGKNNPNTSDVLKDLAHLELKRGNVENADLLFRDFISIEEDSFLKTYLVLNEKGMLEYKNKIENSTRNYFDLRTSNNETYNSGSINELYEKWQSRAGINYSFNLRLREAVDSSNDTIIIDTYKALKNEMAKRSKWIDLSIESRRNLNCNIDSLDVNIQNLERKLYSALDMELTQLSNVEYTKIAALIDSNSIFIQISELDPNEGHFLFSMIKNQDPNPTLIKVKIDLNEVSGLSQIDILENSLLYEHLWKHLEKYTDLSKRIILLTEGIYSKFNASAFYDSNNNRFLFEQKEIIVCENRRAFVRSKIKTKNLSRIENTCTLFGFPDFNLVNNPLPNTNDILTSMRDLSPNWIDSLTRGNLKASPLPATKIEVERISETFLRNGWEVTKLIGQEASEKNIKQVHYPRVLHIATHGYFFEDIPYEKTENRFLGLDRNHFFQNPMLRSGLLFAGANRTLKGEEQEGENGLLSAEEASLLNLRGTELVVLSACETGRGEVKNSEGVYGLRKAFTDAGARNLIMSLWKVDDVVTQEFMTLFYSIWLNDKKIIREAFNQTQLEIKAKYPQPYYWGAFILVGE